MLKRLSEGVRTFSAIENLTLMMLFCSSFLILPPLFSTVFPLVPGLVLSPAYFPLLMETIRRAYGIGAKLFRASQKNTGAVK